MCARACVCVRVGDCFPCAHELDCMCACPCVCWRLLVVCPQGAAEAIRSLDGLSAIISVVDAISGSNAKLEQIGAKLVRLRRGCRVWAQVHVLLGG
jgi:hypothetical protein